MEGSSAATILIELFLSEPEIHLQSPHTAISSIEMSIVIAKPLQYTYADILFVPNVKTTESTILECKQFVESIGLTMDIYNFGLYGTFEPNGIDILGMYKGKTVLILGNMYPQGLGSTSIPECLDVLEVAKVLAEGTTILVCDVEQSRLAETKQGQLNGSR